jgi:hypothetical protein
MLSPNQDQPEAADKVLICKPPHVSVLCCSATSRSEGLLWHVMLTPIKISQSLLTKTTQIGSAVFSLLLTLFCSLLLLCMHHAVRACCGT